ncbi:MAG: class I SAM-dependent methyltransferase [Chthoniobacteraceae bacterium]
MSPSLSTAYLLGLKLRFGDGPGTILRELRRPVRFAQRLVPIDYVRYREFEFTFDAINRFSKWQSLALDVSSPQLVPLTLGHVAGDRTIHATNILQEEVDSTASAARELGISGIVSEIQDVRALPYKDGMFDLVTSVSVVEHIAPEDRGEVPAIKEMARVLKPGGIAVLTVPYAHKRFSEFRAGTVYEREATGTDETFFQRFYDHDQVMDNIVNPSGLELLELSFIGERFFSRNPHKRMAHFINSTMLQNAIFGPWFPLISRIFLTGARPVVQCVKPYIACIVLRKN